MGSHTLNQVDHQVHIQIESTLCESFKRLLQQSKKPSKVEKTNQVFFL